MKADQDVWIHIMVCDNHFEYYEMLFVFVDDILALSHKAMDVVEKTTRSRRPRMAA
jgi:hypothetical protein